MFSQILDPTGNLFVTWLVALVPVVLLLLLLAVFRVSAWLAALIGSIVTFVLAVWVWGMPVGAARRAYLLRLGDRRLERRLDHASGACAVQHAGRHRRLRSLPALAARAGHAGRAGADHPVRLGLRRAARRAGRVRLSLGRRRADPDRARHPRSRRHARRRDRQQCAGLLRRARRADHRARRGDRPAAAGAVGLGRPHRRGAGAAAALDPDLSRQRRAGAARGLAARRSSARSATSPASSRSPSISGRICPTWPARSSASWRCCCCSRSGGRSGCSAMAACRSAARRTARIAGARPATGAEVFGAWLPFIVLIVVVVLWTGPWSPLPDVSLLHGQRRRRAPRSQPERRSRPSSTSRPSSAAPRSSSSWVIVALLLRVDRRRSSREIARTTWHQMWGALLVGVFIFGLAYVFNYSGMAGSLAYAFSKIGWAFIVVAPDPGLDRRRAVGQQHLDQRHVRLVPGDRRQAARLPAAAAADPEFGRRRDRQAGRPADRERRRLDDAASCATRAR